MLSPPAPADLRVRGVVPRPDAAVPGRRLEWLDALRGIAVMAVVFEHLSYMVFREVRQFVITPWFNSGRYGVMVFFLVSGYIIPASLEGHGSVRRFWIGRAFRLYPLLLAAVGSLLALTAVGLSSLDGRLSTDAVTVTLAHLTFLQDLLGVRNFFVVLWTLSYEMVFYLLVTALFIVGIRRRGGEIALGLMLCAVLVAPLLPTVMFFRGAENTRWVVAVSTLVLAAGICCAVRAARGPRLLGAALLGTLAVFLVLFNQRVGIWEGLLVLAVMFTGTAIYHAERGEVGRAKTVAITAAVWVLVLVCGVWNYRLWPEYFGIAQADLVRRWTITMVLTGVTFGAAWLLRHRRFPRPLLWLGTVSYSLYLMHAVLLSVFHMLFDGRLTGVPLLVQIGLATIFFALLFAVAWATHRYVETPGQALGRRVAAGLAGTRTR